ncbi:hypothetical protein [Streptacidiphilus neutrinimicus]|uniref:hypothetical protein n=1 Tax=Streptacidiphilus neutrinimicus TaxID=105420 RepID=UPI0005AA0F00|nr:hypothetical protein [Streptacidiphilus neutrinimicus]
MITVTLLVLLTPLFVLLVWLTIESWATRSRRRAAAPVVLTSEPPHAQDPEQEPEQEPAVR